jgi:hypothetical protein
MSECSKYAKKKVKEKKEQSSAIGKAWRWVSNADARDYDDYYEECLDRMLGGGY